MANATNLYIWTLPAEPVSHKSEDRPESTKKDLPMDLDFAKTMHRLGEAIRKREEELAAALTAPPNRATVPARSGEVWRP
jgi:hypothetical protein